MHPNGVRCTIEEMELQKDAGFRFHYGEETTQMDPIPPDPITPEASGAPATAAEPSTAPTPPLAVEAHTTEPAPAPTAADLAEISKATGGDSTLTIVLALVAVVGGGAAWKFYSKFSEQKHEQAMKQLDLEAKIKGVGAAQPPPCQAANAKLEADIADLKARLAGVEKKAATIGADFDAEDIERQVKKLTKTVKALQEDKS